MTDPKAAAERSMSSFRIKLFADTARVSEMCQMAAYPPVRGFTTNPSMMRNCGVKDYRTFAQDVVAAFPGKSISLEVVSDDFTEMGRQARWLSALGPDVYVKVPITNTRGDSSCDLIRELSAASVKVNVTAVFTIDQVEEASDALGKETPSIISVFAGRIADTGWDPQGLMLTALDIMKQRRNQELLWASCREVLNIFQADMIGCHIITASPEMVRLLSLGHSDLKERSLATVRMFHRDAELAGYTL